MEVLNDNRIDNRTSYIEYITGLVYRALDGFCSVVVTARHCIDKAREHGKLCMRLNLINGTYIEIPTNPDDWYCHPSADVAAIFTPISALPKGIDRQHVDQSSVLANSSIIDLKTDINECDLASLLPQLLDSLISLGDMARQLSQALGSNGHRPEKVAELIQQLVNARG